MKTEFIPIFGRVELGVVMVQQPADNTVPCIVWLALPGLEWRSFYVNSEEAKAFVGALSNALANAPKSSLPPF